MSFITHQTWMRVEFYYVLRWVMLCCTKKIVALCCKLCCIVLCCKFCCAILHSNSIAYIASFVALHFIALRTLLCYELYVLHCIANFTTLCCNVILLRCVANWIVLCCELCYATHRVLLHYIANFATCQVLPILALITYTHRNNN